VASIIHHLRDRMAAWRLRDLVEGAAVMRWSGSAAAQSFVVGLGDRHAIGDTGAADSAIRTSANHP
jgi:hypothetical protein